MVLIVTLDEGAVKPSRAHREDAGLDLYSREDTTVPARGSVTIDTGVHVQIPRGMCGILISKSGLNTNHNITSTGLVDAGYTGSIRVKLYNHGDIDYFVKAGDKVSQLLITQFEETVVVVSDKVNGFSRSDNGFGSSGR